MKGFYDSIIEQIATSKEAIRRLDPNAQLPPMPDPNASMKEAIKQAYKTELSKRSADLKALQKLFDDLTKEAMMLE